MSNYEQNISGSQGVRSKGPRNTIQLADGAGNFLASQANISTTGVLSAPYFIGDGSGLTGVSGGGGGGGGTLQEVVSSGNVVTGNTVQFSNLVTTGYFTGISNLLPVHTLDVGSKFYVSDTQSNVLTVNGRVFVSDKIYSPYVTSSILLQTNDTFASNSIQTYSIISTNTSSVRTTIDTVNANILYINDISVINSVGVGNILRTKFIQASNIVVSNLVTAGRYNGISNLFPIHNLDVGSRFYVDAFESNVLTVRGNIFSTGNVYGSNFIGDGSKLKNVQITQGYNNGSYTIDDRNITIDQDSSNYKTFVITDFTQGTLNNLNFINVVNGSKSTIVFNPLDDIDIIQNLSNTTTSITYLRKNINSNVQD